MTFNQKNALTTVIIAVASGVIVPIFFSYLSKKKYMSSAGNSKPVVVVEQKQLSSTQGAVSSSIGSRNWPSLLKNFANSLLSLQLIICFCSWWFLSFLNNTSNQIIPDLVIGAVTFFTNLQLSMGQPRSSIGSHKGLLYGGLVTGVYLIGSPEIE